jgi:7,8-dihydroneopterin aldolase/epimerase/oxygenase
MADYIELRNIRAWGNHGVAADERQSKQPFDINLVLQIDLRTAQASNKLHDTVDYNLVYKQVVKVVSTTSFQLLESLAGEILSSIFSDKRVRAAQINIAKPGLLDGATAIVSLERANENNQ